MPDDVESPTTDTDPKVAETVVRRRRSLDSESGNIELPRRGQAGGPRWPFSRRNTIVAGATGLVVAVCFVIAVVNLTGGDDAKTTKTTTTTEAPVVTQISANYTIADLLGLDVQYATFLSLAKSSGVIDTLDAMQPVTAFIPDEEAWKNVKDSIEKEDPSQVAQVLRRHLVSGELRLRDLQELSGKDVTTLDGQKLPVVVEGPNVTVGGAKILKANIEASNGVIFVVGSTVSAD